MNEEKKFIFHLKEVGVSCILKKHITSNEARNFLKKLISFLQMDLVFCKTIYLNPGYEILCCIKQSHIVLSYYPEFNFFRINICSCSSFETNSLIEFIKSNLKIVVSKIEVYKNTSLEKEIKRLWKEKN